MSKTLSALIFFVVLTAATLAVYLPGLGNGLVFDDARLSDGTIFDGYSQLALRPRMLSYGSFVWAKSLLGDVWWAQRLVNVLLHLGVAGGLYVLFKDLLRSTRFSDEARSEPGHDASCTAALRVGVALFALNPVAVYAVAYLVQRSTVMAALFVALACAAWVRGLTTKRWYWLVLALVGYLLAVLSKESAFMAAALAVPLYVFVLRPPWKRTALVTGVALVAVVAVAALLSGVYGSIVGVAFDTSSRLYALQLEALRPGISAQLFPLSVLNQAALFFYYGVLWVLPNVQWMSIDLRPGFPLSLAAFPQILGAIGFCAALVGAVWLVLRRSDVWGLVGLCLLCPLLLFFSEFVTVWVQDPFVLYRSYLWALTLPGLIALPFIGFKPKVIYPIGVLLAALFAGLAFERVMSLRDDLSVWSDAIEKVEQKAGANAVGRWRPYLNRGAYHLEREMPESAYDDFVRADALGELQGSARFNMGVALQLMNRHEEALASFAKAESMGFAEPAMSYHRAESQYALRRFAEAYASYDVALSKPQAAEVEDRARLRRAESAIPLQKFDAAISDFTALLQKKPDDIGLQVRLGMTYVSKKDLPQALAIFNRLLATRPAAIAYYGRAMAHMAAADKEAGLRDLDQAIALDPGNPMYKNVRAKIAEQK